MTIGHAGHDLTKMLTLLTAHSVQRLVDARATPRSRRHPEFGIEILTEALYRRNIIYEHAPRLGGLHDPLPDSINTGWRNPGLRGYADYMQTGEFAVGLEYLLQRARRGQVALMCAEATLWRGHRLLISDALVARGVAVEHIFSARRRMPHVPTRFAVVTDGQVSYPG